MKWPILAVFCVCLTLVAICTCAAVTNPIANPSFQDGTSYPWFSYSYTPAYPLAPGSPANPVVAIPGSTFGLLPPYTYADGNYACGMESSAAQSKNGGVCQTFTWTAGGGDLTLKARTATDGSPGGNGCYVRAGVASGSTTNRASVSSWVTAPMDSAWSTITVPVATAGTYTVFIEAYQPAATGRIMSTLWDDVRWTPYLRLTDTPSKTGYDVARPDTTATITWTTNLPATTHIEYKSGTGSWQTIDNVTERLDHSALLENLQPATTCTFRVSGTAAGCVGFSSPDYTIVTPIVLSDMADTVGDPDALITWKTDIPTTSWVDYGLDTAYGQTTGSSDLTTSHSVTLTGLADAKVYHYRIRSGAAGCTTQSSEDRTFRTLPAPQPALVNASFENLQGGTPNMYPWDSFTYSLNAMPVSGILGPYPAGGSTSWFPDEVGIQAYDGSYFLGAGSRYTYRNGGYYQRIRLASAQTVALTARFAAFQSDEGDLGDTRVTIGLDPAGGTDPNAASVRWWSGISPSNDNKWYPGGVVVNAPAGVVTLFLGTKQVYGLAARAVAIDDAVFGQPQTMAIGDLRSRTRCPGAILADKIVTYVSPSMVSYEGKSYQKIYIQEPSCPSGISVLLGPIDTGNPPDLPQVRNKISVTGALMTVGKETVFMGYNWTVDHGTFTLPRPVALKQKDIGGSAYNQPPLNNPGACNLGVRMKLFGKITSPDIGMEGPVYIDDGSKLPTSLTDYSTGLPVYGALLKLTNKDIVYYKGDYIAATGVLTLENIGSVGWPEYRYVLQLSEYDDWTVLQAAPQE